MADITYDQKSVEQRAAQGIIPGKGDANSLKCLVSSAIELAPTASGQTIVFGRIPANSRLSGLSRVYWDDLSTNGAPTLDLGLASVGANITSDDDCLSAGHTLATADPAGEPAIDDIGDNGEKAWVVAGASTDPSGQLDVYGTIRDAATVGLTATLMVEIYGYFD
jgi:hypothetical protein